MTGASTVHADRHEAAGPDELAGDVNANARVGVREAAGTTYKRRRLSLNEGNGVDITVADDSVDEEVDVTIAVDYTEAATALAGNGLDASAGTLVVDPEEFTAALAGFGLDANGGALDIDPEEITPTMAGAGLAANVDALDVNAGNGTIITADAIDVDLAMVATQPPDSQTIPANYAAYVPSEFGFTIADGTGLTLESGAAMESGPLGPLQTYPARMGIVTAQNIAVATNVTQIAWDTVIYDPWGCCTTGASAKYTCGASGFYEIDALVTWFSSNSPDEVYLTIYVNSAEVSRGHNTHTAAGAVTKSNTVHDTLYCAAGDAIDVRAYHSVGGNANAITVGLVGNHFTARRVA